MLVTVRGEARRGLVAAGVAQDDAILLGALPHVWVAAAEPQHRLDRVPLVVEGRTGQVEMEAVLSGLLRYGGDDAPRSRWMSPQNAREDRLRRCHLDAAPNGASALSRNPGGRGRVSARRVERYGSLGKGRYRAACLSYAGRDQRADIGRHLPAPRRWSRGPTGLRFGDTSRRSARAQIRLDLPQSRCVREVSRGRPDEVICTPYRSHPYRAQPHASAAAHNAVSWKLLLRLTLPSRNEKK